MRLPYQSHSRAYYAVRLRTAILLALILLLPEMWTAKFGLALAQTPAWHSTTALPEALETFAAAVDQRSDGQSLYVVGGLDVDMAMISNKVRIAPITGSGSGVGSLGTFTSVNFNNGLQALYRDICGVIYNHNLYAIGGISSSQIHAPQTTAAVWYAPIDGMGNIGQWINTTSLPLPLQLHGSVAVNGYLYVMGGSSDLHDDHREYLSMENKVYYAPINSNGSVGSWNQTGVLPGAEDGGPEIYKTCPLAVPTGSGNRIYLVGGETSGQHVLPCGLGMGSAVVQVAYAVQQSDGTLSGWTVNQDHPLPCPVAAQAIAYDAVSNSIVLMGGDATGMGGDSTVVYQGTLDSNFDVTGWSFLPSLQGVTGPISRNAGATWNGYVYTLGGLVGLNDDTNAVYYLKVP